MNRNNTVIKFLSLIVKMNHFNTRASELVLPIGLTNGQNSTESTFYNKVVKTSDPNAIGLAKSYLKRGGVIALPTDTIYGVSCNANDANAVKRLYAVKEREEEKPVAICVAEIDKLRHWGEASHLPDDLLHQLLPGAVTIVLKKTKNLDNPHLNPGTSKIGIRIPDFPFIRDLCRTIHFPLALTSANKSSEKSTLNINEFRKLWPDLAGVFDGGQIALTESQRAGSTVIDLSTPSRYKIIREGVAIKHTLEVLFSYGYRDADS